MAFWVHPFEEAGNLGILSARYKVPDAHAAGYSDDLVEVIRRCLQVSLKTRKRLSKPMLNFKKNWENHAMKYKAPRTKASQQHQPRKKKLHPNLRQMSKLFPRLKHKS